jgi:hypothetical protein
MYIPFEQLPEESRIWIYPANRKLSDEEIAEMEQLLLHFVNQWSAHGSALEASFKVVYQRFIVLAVNTSVQAPTGCSIDASVALIQQLEQQYQIDLLDKMNVTFRQGEFITHKTLLDFKRMVKEKSVGPNTIVFNNLVNTVEEWQSHWEVPAAESWHARFF